MMLKSCALHWIGTNSNAFRGKPIISQILLILKVKLCCSSNLKDTFLRNFYLQKFCQKIKLCIFAKVQFCHKYSFIFVQLLSPAKIQLQIRLFRHFAMTLQFLLLLICFFSSVFPLRTVLPKDLLCEKAIQTFQFLLANPPVQVLTHEGV